MSKVYNWFLMTVIILTWFCNNSFRITKISINRIWMHQTNGFITAIYWKPSQREAQDNPDLDFEIQKNEDYTRKSAKMYFQVLPVWSKSGFSQNDESNLKVGLRDFFCAWKMLSISTPDNCHQFQLDRNEGGAA